MCLGVSFCTTKGLRRETTVPASVNNYSQKFFWQNKKKMEMRVSSKDYELFVFKNEVTKEAIASNLSTINGSASRQRFKTLSTYAARKKESRVKEPPSCFERSI